MDLPPTPREQHVVSDTTSLLAIYPGVGKSIKIWKSIANIEPAPRKIKYFQLVFSETKRKFLAPNLFGVSRTNPEFF